MLGWFARNFAHGGQDWRHSLHLVNSSAVFGEVVALL
jgi:hypothetical protein